MLGKERVQKSLEEHLGKVTENSNLKYGVSGFICNFPTVRALETTLCLSI